MLEFILQMTFDFIDVKFMARTVRTNAEKGSRYFSIDHIASIYINEEDSTAEVLLSNGLVYKVTDAFDVKNLIGVFCHG